MTPPLMGTIGEREGTKTKTVGLNRGVAPKYRPPDDFPGEVLNPNDPAWAELDRVRQEAWNLGITETELLKMTHGWCPFQIKSQQIPEVRAWVDSHR